MAFKTKRLLKKIVSWSGLFFFVVAAYMIYHQLSKYKLEDIKDALVSIPAHNLFLACMARSAVMSPCPLMTFWL